MLIHSREIKTSVQQSKSKRGIWTGAVVINLIPPFLCFWTASCTANYFSVRIRFHILNCGSFELVSCKFPHCGRSYSKCNTERDYISVFIPNRISCFTDSTIQYFDDIITRKGIMAFYECAVCLLFGEPLVQQLNETKLLVGEQCIFKKIYRIVIKFKFSVK